MTQVLRIKDIRSLQMTGKTQPVGVVIDLLQYLTGSDLPLLKLIRLTNRKPITMTMTVRPSLVLLIALLTGQFHLLMDAPKMFGQLICLGIQTTYTWDRS